MSSTLTRDPRIPGYAIESELGRGGMGVVYRARDLGLERLVALKTLSGETADDPRFRRRFVRESRAAASLEHPNVVPIYDATEHDGELYIVMRLIAGGDLQRRLANEGPLALDLAAAILGQVADALDAAHRAGLVHRDVKPANVLLDGPRDRPHAYLSDFGVARNGDDDDVSLTVTGYWVGTLDYAAPEQIEGRPLDARSDVYALGCVLFAMLTGRPPFADRRGLAKAVAHTHEPPPTLAQAGVRAPAGVQAALDRALAKAPEDRFVSAGELDRAVREAIGGGPTGRRMRRKRASEPAPVPPVRAAAHVPAPTHTRTLRYPAPPHAPAPARRRASRARRHRGGGALAAILGLIVLAGAAAAVLALTTPGSHGAGKHAAHHAAKPARPAPPPAASADAGTVLCARGSCHQGATLVSAPIQGAVCNGSAGPGVWTRIDAGAPQPMLLCVPTQPPANGYTPNVPNLVGARLDLAEVALDRLGLDYDTSGGGLIGMFEPSSLEVCSTQPTAGEFPSYGPVELNVGSSC